MSQFVMKPPYEWPIVATRFRAIGTLPNTWSTPAITSSPSFVPHAPHVPHRNFSP